MKRLPLLIPPLGDLREWAQEATNVIRSLTELHNQAHPQIVRLQHIEPGAKATEDGLIMWDATESCPVVSEGGTWKKIALTP